MSNRANRITREQLERENQSDSEAIEDNQEAIQDQEENLIPVDEDSGEDLDQNAQDDYKSIGELDQYEQESADQESYSDMHVSQREDAEDEIRDRQLAQQRRKKKGRFDDILYGLDEDSSNDQYNQRIEARLGQNYQRYQDADEDDEQRMVSEDEEEEKFEEEKYLDKEQAKGKLMDWIQEPRTKRYIRFIFKKFLRNFKKDGSPKPYYKEKISKMCKENKSSLEIEFCDLQITENMQTIMVWIMYEPSVIIPELNKVVREVVLSQYPEHENITSHFSVKITQFNYFDNLRDLRHKNIGHLLQVQGVITKRSAVYNQLIEYWFTCDRCDQEYGPFYDENPDTNKVGKCVHCQSRGPYTLEKQKCIYRNYQKVTLQETPGDVPAGRVPTQKEVILLGDNIDVARPGDEVTVIGVYTYKYDYVLNLKHGFPLFSTCIEANNIKCLADVENIKIDPSELKKIQEWAKKPNIKDIIINSIAPSIHGHRNVKTALALSMFGGESKQIGGKHRTRGDINVLIMGDPGVAKSQFLKSVQKTFTRTVYTTGKGATAVGLTASVKRDADTKEWTLEGGALVLADQGICLIDEFDKMNDYDRTSIHEAMEQQSISISKAGIVASLQARCSVVAAANPKAGRYNPTMSFMDNVDLTDPIVSRFDVLCVVKDEVNHEHDSNLASFVINSHIKSHPYFNSIFKKDVQFEDIDTEQQQQENDMEVEENQEMEELKQMKLELLDTILPERKTEKTESMPIDLLKKYIVHARTVHPKITSVELAKIKDFYVNLRQSSKQNDSLPIAVRHIESIVRMAEAFAKMNLSTEVKSDDIDRAISVMLRSFIQSNKASVSKNLETNFKKYLKEESDDNQLIAKLLRELLQFRQQAMVEQDQKVSIPIINLQNRASQNRIGDITNYLNSEEFKELYVRVGDTIQYKF